MHRRSPLRPLPLYGALRSSTTIVGVNEPIPAMIRVRGEDYLILPANDRRFNELDDYFRASSLPDLIVSHIYDPDMEKPLIALRQALRSCRFNGVSSEAVAEIIRLEQVSEILES